MVIGDTDRLNGGATLDFSMSHEMQRAIMLCKEEELADERSNIEVWVSGS